MYAEICQSPFTRNQVGKLALSEALSIYLLIAIGIKGGIELSHYSLGSVMKPILGTLFLGVIIPIVALFVLRFMKMDLKNGSVSIVTYGAAISFLGEYDFCSIWE